MRTDTPSTTELVPHQELLARVEVLNAAVALGGVTTYQVEQIAPLEG